MPGVAASGGIDSGATVVVGATLTPGEIGRAVTGGTTEVGADDDPGARVGAGVVTLDETVTTADESDVDVGTCTLSVLEAPLSEPSSLTTELSGDVVESPDLVTLHTTIATPRTKTMIETGVIHFRAMGGRYQFPELP